MRIVHWLFVVSVALFVSGIGFVVAGARAVRQAPSVRADAPVTITPVASVKQIMRGIVTPAATTVFRSVGTIVTVEGTEEHAPRTEEEWEVVGSAAAALIESGNMMLTGNRPVDKGEWVQMTQALIDASKIALQGAQEKNKDKVFDVGEAINASCDSCHQKYQRGS